MLKTLKTPLILFLAFLSLSSEISNLKVISKKKQEKSSYLRSKVFENHLSVFLYANDV